MPINTIIRTPADHAAALAEIDRMGDPEIGTPEFERLDGLVTQVKEYEAEQFPMNMPSAEAVEEYEAEKRGQRFEDAKASTFAQYDSAMQSLAAVDGMRTAGADWNWEQTGSTWRLYDAVGEQVGKVISHPNGIVWLACDDPLTTPAQGPYTDAETAKGDCLAECKRRAQSKAALA